MHLFQLMIFSNRYSNATNFSIIFALALSFFLYRPTACIAQVKPVAEPEFTVEEYEELNRELGGDWGRKRGGFFIPPGKLFPDGMHGRLENRPEIGWFSLQYLDDYADGILPKIKPGMLKEISDEPRVTGLKLDSSVGASCRNCPKRLEFGDDVLRDLPSLGYVKCLRMHYVDLRKPHRVQFIRDMKSLDWLQVYYCGTGLKSFFRNLGPLPKLETLIIAPGGRFASGEKTRSDLDAISAKDVANFAKRVPNLRVLKIIESIDTPMTAETVHAFAHLKKLEHLAVAPVENRDYRKYTEAHDKYYFEVIKPLHAALPKCKTEMSALELDLTGTGLPSLRKSK
ncbi:MAG: hypothetical protein MI725_00900 [Pirellulales bacterium]|nr:hypothetical protein [Pirellulales bacterium]